jgi:hypothetical protein
VVRIFDAEEQLDPSGAEAGLLFISQTVVSIGAAPP